MIIELVQYMHNEGGELLSQYMQREFGHGYKYDNEDIIQLLYSSDGDDVVEVEFSVVDNSLMRAINTEDDSRIDYYEFSSVEEIDVFFTDLDYDKLVNSFKGRE